MTPGYVVTLGRICAQKGPDYFLEAFKSYGGSRRWVWVGGANDDDRKHLRIEDEMSAAGIVVTGWLERPVAVTWLEGAHVYVHTAAWEGFPVTIMEAAAAGLPIVARDIPAVAHEGVEPLATSPVHLARWVEALDDEVQWRRGVLRSVKWLTERTGRSQREALLHVYGMASPDPDLT